MKGCFLIKADLERGSGGVLWNLLLNVQGYTEESLSQPAAASSLFKGAYIQISLP